MSDYDPLLAHVDPACATKTVDVPALVDALRQEIRTLQKRVTSLETKLASQRIELCRQCLGKPKFCEACSCLGVVLRGNTK